MSQAGPRGNHSVTKAITRLSLTNNHLHLSRTSSSSSTSIASPPLRLPPSVIAKSQGIKYTTTYANYATTTDGKLLSYFHDIPLDLDLGTQEANFVCEIPRWSNAKFEISPHLPANPIVQDVKSDAVRFVKNLFPYHGYIHNYGAFPQTWEDPTQEHAGLYGDNDPLDVCEIGSDILHTGDVRRVKILGALALIDDGELDWKVVVVDVRDPLASSVNDIDDVETLCPGLLSATRQWFKDYKLADGKAANRFAFEAKYKSAREALQVVADCHQSWQRLISGQVGTTEKVQSLPAIANTTIKGSPGHLSEFDTKLDDSPPQPDAEVPQITNKNYYFK
ncbi:uncharacterized protein LODBEIA_P06730 [Lodderomyces beijingensis]|uniref:inorganic diphosphatase n=1 Tax=Lodderomyces beijingensis TaxID=1775926 RepID=A0ABP0ZE40_9ASCO